MLFRSLSFPKICFGQLPPQPAILGGIGLYPFYKVLRPQFKILEKLICNITLTLISNMYK